MKTCVHVIHSLEYGGAQKDLYYYAKFHDSDRYKLEIISFHPGGEMIPEFESLGIKVHVLDRRSSDPLGIVHLKKLFRKLGADIVHFHNSLPVFAGVPAACLGRVPLKVMTEHSIYYPGKAGNAITTSLYFNLRRRLDMVIACSEEVRRSHSDNFDPERTVTIVNGVDLDEFTPQEPAAAKDPGIYSIGSVGSLTVQKGYPNLLKAVAVLAEKDIPARLTLVGDGPLREDLERQAAESGITDRVVFAGATGDVASKLRSFDVIAGSSIREGLPLSILEAMASGLPVVTTDVGGNREAVEDGVTGLLVPPGDSYALADALTSLWTDAEKRTSMGAAGRARAENLFSARKMVSGTEQLYEELLEEKR
jgi:glycosyltransferase involved in cell wall biosynthesis